MIQRNAIHIHEVGGEAGGFINGQRDVVAAMLTHLDPDAVIVPRTVEVGVLSLFTARQVLNGDIRLSGEVPGEKANAIASRALGGPQRSTFQGQGMVIGIATVVLRAVDGDVFGRHGPIFISAYFACGNEVGSQADFAEQLLGGDSAQRTVIVASFPHGDLRAASGRAASDENNQGHQSEGEG